MEKFLIGNMLVEIDYCGIPVLSEGNLQRFRYDAPWSGERIQLDTHVEPLEHYITPEYDRENHVYGIYDYQNEPLIAYHWGSIFHGFAVWPNKFAVTFDPKMFHQPALREDWFFSVCAFHRQLLTRHACVFHASYVDIGGEALLFAGPSGMGKSTQAGLWSEYAGAEVINGDRALLKKIDGKWHAFGYPTCGTSGICINRNLPLRAIVLLSKAPVNRIEALPAAAKVRALIAATELYPWAEDEFDMALEIASDVAAHVPMIQLCCRPDRDAVEILKNYLENEQ